MDTIFARIIKTLKKTAGAVVVFLFPVPCSETRNPSDLNISDDQLIIHAGNIKFKQARYKGAHASRAVEMRGSICNHITIITITITAIIISYLDTLVCSYYYSRSLKLGNEGGDMVAPGGPGCGWMVGNTADYMALHGCLSLFVCRGRRYALQE